MGDFIIFSPFLGPISKKGELSQPTHTSELNMAVRVDLPSFVLSAKLSRRIKYQFSEVHRCVQWLSSHMHNFQVE